MGEAYPTTPNEDETEPAEDDARAYGAGPEDELIRLDGVRRARQRALAKMQPVPVQAPSPEPKMHQGDPQ